MTKFVRAVNILVTILAFANSAHAEMGFYLLENQRVPEAVKKASDSVFKVSELTGEYSIVNSMEELQSLISEYGDYDEKDELDVILNRSQLAFCQQHEVLPCIYVSSEHSMFSATIFVAESSDTLWTNLHTINEQVSRFMKWCRDRSGFYSCLEQLKQRPLMLLLEDKNGDRINRPEGATIKIASSSLFEEAYEIGAFSDRSKFTLAHQLSDAVKLKANWAVGKPLHFTDEESNLGDESYLVGYPAQTVDREVRFGKPDAPGGLLRVTFGRFVDLYDGQAATTNKFQKSQYYDVVDTHLLHSFMDATYGMSGGPIMNKQGEVVGIITESDVTLKGKEPALTLGLTKKRLFNLESTQLSN